MLAHVPNNSESVYFIFFNFLFCPFQLKEEKCSFESRQRKGLRSRVNSEREKKNSVILEKSSIFLAFSGMLMEKVGRNEAVNDAANVFQEEEKAPEALACHLDAHHDFLHLLDMKGNGSFYEKGYTSLY